MKPSMLYHYTDIESLEKILESKTIRFNNLKNLDDSLEDINFDVDFSKSTFVSCWTNDANESIPLWHMYSKRLSGIRLGIQSDMFLTVSGKGIPRIERVSNIEHIKANETPGLTLLELNEIGMSTVDFVPRLVEVEYITQDTLKIIHDSIKIEIDNSQVIRTGIYGKYKSLVWAFQKEWRFIILLNPYTLQEIYDFNLENLRCFTSTNRMLNLTEFIKRKYEMNKEIPQFVLIHMKEEALNEAIITLGPCITEQDRIKVHELIKKHTPTVKIFDSSLKIVCKNLDRNLKNLE